jgi:hypothetical protein
MGDMDRVVMRRAPRALTAFAAAHASVVSHPERLCVTTVVSQFQDPVISPSKEPTMQALIPGAYERNTLTHRQAGAMSGPAYGSSDQPAGPSLLDAATTAAREMEGGGGVSQRPHRVSILVPDGRRPARISHHAEPPIRGFSWLRFWRFARR